MGYATLAPVSQFTMLPRFVDLDGRPTGRWWLPRHGAAVAVFSARTPAGSCVTRARWRTGRRKRKRPPHH